jgi:hypothetical protein
MVIYLAFVAMLNVNGDPGLMCGLNQLSQLDWIFATMYNIFNLEN